MSKLVLVKYCIETFIRWLIIRYKNGISIFRNGSKVSIFALLLDIVLMPIMFVIFVLIIVFKNKMLINSRYYIWAEHVFDCVWG